MQLVESGILARAERGTARATLTFGALAPLRGGAILATCRAGSTKDAPDEEIALFRSEDGGRTWGHPARPFGAPRVNGVAGSLKLCYLTEIAAGRLLAAAMWVDRSTYPGQALFNADTEGCLPMAILLAESADDGQSWSPWRHVRMPDEVGPPSLTGPILALADGALGMSIETNKHYHDRSPWRQKALFFRSMDGGLTWGPPDIVAHDSTGRIFNWDLRCCVGQAGAIAAFAWTYDTRTARYLNIHRRISRDHGLTWGPPLDLGIADQAGPPAVLQDGRIVLAWVDRFGSHAIRARTAPAIDAVFDPASDTLLYAHGAAAQPDANTGELLAAMGTWSYGLPFAAALPDGDVLVLYYAGDDGAMDMRWARLAMAPSRGTQPQA